MKRIVSFFAVAMLCALPPVWAQGFVDDSEKLWADGPLTLDDFDRRDVGKEEKVLSQLSWHIGLDRQTTTQGNLRYTTISTETSMDRLTSWYCPQAATPWTLRYNQAIFDRVEVVRRKMQNDLNAHPADYARIFDYYNRFLQNETEKFEQESQMGTDTAVIAKMEALNKAELESYVEEPMRTPEIVKPSWGLGMRVGYAGECFGMPVAEGLTMSNGFELSFNLEVKKLCFEWGMTMGNCGKLMADNFYYDVDDDYMWQRGKNCTAGSMWLMGGFRAVDTPRLALRPMVGFGVGFLDQSIDRNNSESAGFRLTAGLAADYKLRRRYSIYDQDYMESCVTFRLYGDRTTFKGIGETYSINFGIGINLTEWAIP